MRTLFLATLIASLSPGVCAGPLLDDLLNYVVVDQRSPEEAPKEEGMGLVSQGSAAFLELTKEQPVGQTFRLGPNADVLWRVCVGICHWPDSWQPGEEVTFTLYDSPERTKKLYSRTLDFDHKWFKWDVAYDMHLPTKPDSGYYFELTHNGGGDNLIRVAYIPSDSYSRGSAFVAGQAKPEFDLYFVALSKHKGSREDNLDRLISRFDLSHKDMAEVKAAADRKDREAACAAIVQWFDKHIKSADWVWRLPPNSSYDTSAMDRVCDENRLYGEDEHANSWIPMGSEQTWREVWPETSSYVRMNDLFASLGHAYAATRNDKYAAKMQELMADYMQDNASPFEGGMRGGRWVAMFQAWRLGDAWDGIANAIESPALSADIKLAWLDYWSRMAHFAMTEPSGGNHANAVAEALMKFATRFPVFRDSKTWFEFGWDKLVSNSLKLFRNDGGCVEPAMNYHGFSLGNLQEGLKTGESFGLKPPPELNERLEKALAYTAYMLKPDGTIPTYGDTNCEDFRPDTKKWDGWRKGEAGDGARLFGRSDLLYIATAGKQGTRPPFNSYRFPDTGHYILRSDWGGEKGAGFEDARYMFLRGGRFGSHGHDDLNAVTLYAYGRSLLIDPGRTTYGTPLMSELSKNRSHNVLLVDDLDMNHPSPRLNAWHTTGVMDLVENQYSELYPGVEHRRAVIFARPDYYVVFDKAASDAPHTFGVNFWLTPPEVTVDEKSACVHTNESKGSNLMLKAVARQGVCISLRNGTVDLADTIRNDIPVVTFQRKDTSGAEFATVLYPFPAKADPAAVRVREFGVENGIGGVVTSPRGADILAYCWADGRAKLPGEAFSFEGKACLARLSDRSFTLIGGRLLTLQGTTMASSNIAVGELCVEYLKDAVVVNCSDADPALQVASLGRNRAVVNGKSVSISGSHFRPFGR